ncbi:putative valacyclovir hydrolase [Teratosphaeria nubilosa]|uniref:Putative valacyclovir hydrolase n=1 Tax=Teratosphaeria nubilosa TaxID=161662 RepID=A0A6G1KUE9_9PEZI|nr:putative valacyclovir hydrolase [Teratosphaeria nubilosa]
MAHHILLPDGRNLDYSDNSPNNCLPLLWIHSTPGSYIALPALKSACQWKNIRLITMSRAGYGITKCVVGGWSGGGPHAIACAARLPGCVAVFSVAAVAPYGVADLDFLAGQRQDNIDKFNAAFQGETPLQSFVAAQRPDMLKGDAAGIAEALASLLPPVDREAVLNSDIGVFMADSNQEALRHGADGWVDDDLAFVKPWGFGLGEVKVSVILYQGSEDLMVPFAHGEWLARHLPEKFLRKHLLQGEGHVSIFLGKVEEMLGELLKIAGS